MKRLGFTVFAAAVLALPLCAQVATTFRADIPFEFTIENSTAASGNYAITFTNGSPVVRVAGSHNYYLLAQPNGYSSSQAPTLYFHRYGNQYFLSRISTASMSRDITVSRVESELKTTAAGRTRTEIVLAMR